MSPSDSAIEIPIGVIDCMGEPYCWAHADRVETDDLLYAVDSRGRDLACRDCGRSLGPKTPPEIVSDSERPVWALWAFIGQELMAKGFTVDHGAGDGTLVVRREKGDLVVSVALTVADQSQEDE